MKGAPPVPEGSQDLVRFGVLGSGWRYERNRNAKSEKAPFFLTAVGVSECPNCHEKKLPHRACPKCGEYKGRAVLEVKEAAK